MAFFLSSDDEDEIQDENQIGKLKKDWPFLFELKWQTPHFLRLCGKNLEIPMQDYCDNQLRLLCQYLANSATESGVKNVAELWEWEDSERNPRVHLLLAIKMIANYFNEKTISFIKTAEVS